MGLFMTDMPTQFPEGGQIIVLFLFLIPWSATTTSWPLKGCQEEKKQNGCFQEKWQTSCDFSGFAFWTFLRVYMTLPSGSSIGG